MVEALKISLLTPEVFREPPTEFLRIPASLQDEVRRQAEKRWFGKAWAGLQEGVLQTLVFEDEFGDKSTVVLPVANLKKRSKYEVVISGNAGQPMAYRICDGSSFGANPRGVFNESDYCHSGSAQKYGGTVKDPDFMSRAILKCFGSMGWEIPEAVGREVKKTSIAVRAYRSYLDEFNHVEDHRGVWSGFFRVPLLNGTESNVMITLLQDLRGNKVDVVIPQTGFMRISDDVQATLELIGQPYSPVESVWGSDGGYMAGQGENLWGMPSWLVGR